MCARTTQVETTDPGEAVASMAEKGSPGEELVESVLAVHRVPAAQPVVLFEVRGRHDVAGDDSRRKVRRIRFERSDGRVGNAIACRVVPVRFTELTGRVLEERCHDM